MFRGQSAMEERNVSLACVRCLVLHGSPQHLLNTQIFAMIP